MITPDLIINAVCEALELDRDRLLIEKAQRNQNYKCKYADAGYIAAYLIRKKVLVPKTTKIGGQEMKPPTYKQIAYVFKRKAHKTIMDWEIEAHTALRDKKPEFVE